MKKKKTKQRLDHTRIKLSFLGAAQNVTGSRYLVEANGLRVLVECGLYQERQFRARNWEAFAVPPESIDAVLLTHAHLDHCGLLPKLVRDGFGGRVYGTAATTEIARIILLDAAHLQEEDAEYKRKRHRKERRKGPRPVAPLYTAADAEKCSSLFSPVPYRHPIRLGKAMTAAFHDAGHVFGSSMITLTIKQGRRQRTILFSGDVGRKNMPILEDPTVFRHADYVLVESTYGDRAHQSPEDVDDALAEVINTTRQAGGNIVIPSFALERSQDILYHLNELLIAGRIPPLAVFLDSPMAINITKVFEDHPELFDSEMTKRIAQHMSPFSFPGLKMTATTHESRGINRIKGTAAIIAGSGMCTGGRVKHHLSRNITKPQSTILFVGYQAPGTLGRHIVDGAKEVRILGRPRRVRARIARVYGFSAHADQAGLLQWLSALTKAPKAVFVVHGEAERARHFADYLKEKKGWNTSVPGYMDEVILD